MKIHPNKETAMKAIDEYQKEIHKLQERTGVVERCVDECADIYVEVRFYSAEGTVCRYSE